MPASGLAGPPAATPRPEAAWGGGLAEWDRPPADPAGISQDGDAPSGLRLKARADHLDEVLQLTPHTAVTHTVVVVAVLLLFWKDGPPLYLTLLFFGIVLPATLATIGARRHRAHPPGAADTAAGYRIAHGLALILGLAWGTLPVALFPILEAEGRIYVTAIVAGLMASTYTLGALPSLGLYFAAPIALGGFLALVLTGGTVAWSLSPLLGVYSIFVIATAGRMSRLAEQRIVDRVRADEQNETINLLLHDFAANTSDWLWETDTRGRLQHVSDRLGEAVGAPPGNLREAPFEALFLGLQRRRPMTPEIAEILALVAERKAFRERTVEVTIGGVACWWSLSGKSVLGRDGAFQGFRGVGSDISETRQVEARIAYLANYDSLTGLANRTLFHDRTTQACRRALGRADGTGGGIGGGKRNGRGNGEGADDGPEEQPCALLYLDLDGFKFVNDTFGHALGDVLLVRVAQRLTGAVPPGALVARLGGDEFAILVPDGDEDALVALGRRLIRVLSCPYTLDGVQVEIGASIGLALAPRHAHSPEALLGKADLALYRAKARGRGKVRVFSADLEASMRLRREIEADLKRAVGQNEFTLHYQPLVGLDDGRVRTFEALLRWTRGSGAPISPAEFVPVAEASGLITEIGRWVLMQACQEATRWPDDVRLAVNLSPVQFRNTDLAADVTLALDASGLAPERLEIEVTESVFFEMNPTTIANLKELRALGIRVALDDFGTGYSSLSYLIRFPVDKIKIDRSFIKDMGSRPECLAIVEAILTLARKLSISVTAEGVETVEQARMLKASHCDDIQGFLFSPARPADEIEHLIADLPVRFGEIFPLLPLPFRRAAP